MLDVAWANPRKMILDAPMLHTLNEWGAHGGMKTGLKWNMEMGDKIRPLHHGWALRVRVRDRVRNRMSGMGSGGG